MSTRTINKSVFTKMKKTGIFYFIFVLFFVISWGVVVDKYVTYEVNAKDIGSEVTDGSDSRASEPRPPEVPKKYRMRTVDYKYEVSPYLKKEKDGEYYLWVDHKYEFSFEEVERILREKLIENENILDGEFRLYTLVDDKGFVFVVYENRGRIDIHSDSKVIRVFKGF